MRAIKALVIGMGLLLVVGLGVLGFGLYRASVKTTAPAAAPSPPIAGFGTVTVPLAPGAQVISLHEAGGRLAVLVDEGGARRVVVLDPATGTLAGSFVLVPAP